MRTGSYSECEHSRRLIKVDLIFLIFSLDENITLDDLIAQLLFCYLTARYIRTQS